MSGKSIASMVLGILSILLSVWGYLPLIMGIVAIVLGGWSIKSDKGTHGMAITGLVTGIIGVLFGLFWSLVWTAIIGTAASI